jgi:hypothetical protein
LASASVDSLRINGSAAAKTAMLTTRIIGLSIELRT